MEKQNILNNFTRIPPPIKPFYKRIKKEQLHYSYLIRNLIRPLNNISKGVEKKASFGLENENNIFYIIGFPRGEDGLFFLILCNLSHIGYALEHGYIPIIDQQNYPNQYLNPELLTKENSWEYYFNQPFKYSLDDIKNSKNIILSRKLQMPNKKYTIDFYIFEDLRRLYYFRDLFKKIIIPNSKTMEYLITSYNNIFTGKTNILGVLCRGTDYIKKKPGGHPIQPQPEDVIKKAKEIIEKYNCKYLYLATEDQDIFETFKLEFGNKLISNNQRRFKQSDFNNFDYISQALNYTNHENFYLGLEYLSSIYNLSKCEYFLGGKTAGTIGVYLMSDGFIYDYVWDLGFYPLPSIFKNILKKIKMLKKNKIL